MVKNSLSSIKWGHIVSHTFAINLVLDDIPTTRSLTTRSFIVLYADGILLIAPSVNQLQRLFRNCEKELEWLDMSINVKKIMLSAYWSKI